MKDALDRGPPKGSRLVRIGIWTSAIGVVLVLLAGLVARAGLLSNISGMGAYAAGSLLLVIALVTAGLGLIRARGAAPVAAWLALAVALVVTGINADTMRGMGSRFHDISTDPANPPAFVAVGPLRTPDDNSIEYTGPAKAPEGVVPLLVPASTATVFAAALATVKDSGWTVVEAKEGEGRIEATAESGWVPFKDDVVIRVADIGGQTRVDVRSKSRVGRRDMGVNARRVRQYLEDLKAHLES